MLVLILLVVFPSIFKIFKLGIRLAFGFNWSFRNLHEHQLIDSCSLFADIICRFPIPVFPLVDEYTRILSQHLKKGVGTQMSFEKSGELSNGFRKASRVYKYTF